MAGIGAPPDEPIFAVVGVDDPWYANLAEDERWKHCGDFLEGRPGSRSEVIFEPGAHDVFDNAAKVEAMVNFLSLTIGG